MLREAPRADFFPDRRRPLDGQVAGVVLADQLKSLDWRARKATLIERASPEVVSMVMARLLPLLGPPQSPR